MSTRGRADRYYTMQLDRDAMSIEERFGVRVPEGDEARPIFASVNALVDHIVRTTS